MPRNTSGKLRIALVGTRGVPARYGGFETAVEEVGRRLVEAGHEVVVYCRTSGDQPRPSTHLGMHLVHLPALHRRSLETLSHTGLSVAHLLAHRVDAAIVFNAANAPTQLLAYGAPVIADGAAGKLADVDLTPRGFHLAVARFEPENHVDVIVDGYRRSGATLPLVVVGSAPYADEYTARVHSLADDRVRFLGGLWDQELLDQLYAHCATYLHGHSVGGTNPSLLRAIGAGAATIAFDVSFNREVLQASGRYFRTAEDVAAEVTAAEADPARVRRDGDQARVLAARYDWDDVATGYQTLCRRLAARDFPRSRPSGRRRASTTPVSPEPAPVRQLTRPPVPLPRAASAEAVVEAPAARAAQS